MILSSKKFSMNISDINILRKETANFKNIQEAVCQPTDYRQLYKNNKRD